MIEKEEAVRVAALASFDATQRELMLASMNTPTGWAEKREHYAEYYLAIYRSRVAKEELDRVMKE